MARTTVVGKKQPDVLIRVHCNQCRHSTNHRTIKSSVSAGTDEEQGYYWRTEYRVLQCCGCDEIVLRREFFFSENPGSDVTFFPPPISRWLPNWQWSLPIEIRTLLEEVYRALQADSLTLAMMGARALIETAMVKKVGDQRGFDEHLKAMQAQGHVSSSNRKYLAVALDAGSASAHRAHRPNADQINTVMDIVENFLHSVFVLGKQTDKLQAGIPPRPPRKRTKPAKP